MSFWQTQEVRETVSGPLPEGKYRGRVAKVEVKKTQAGHRSISLEFAFNDGHKAWDNLNVDHEKTKQITMESITKILRAAYKDPPQELETIDDVTRALAGVPVSIMAKHKGVDDKGRTRVSIYYNMDVDDAEKLSFASHSKDY